MGGKSVIFTENLTRIYKVLSRGFYDPGTYFETYGSRFLYEVFMKSVFGKKEIYALNGVSLSIEEGEFVCLLGPNGSGKSTLIKVLATLIPPSSGRAEVMGYDVEKERNEAIKHITYIPSLIGASAWAQPSLTVRQNLKIMSDLFDLQFEDVLKIGEKLGLTETMDRPFGSLSTGQQSRIGLLAGMLRRSPIYLLDEPLMGVSPEAAKIVNEYLLKLNKEFKVTMLYATHHPLEAQDIASRIIIMNRGKVIADGKPEELIKNSGVKKSITMEVYRACFNLRPILEELEPDYLDIQTINQEIGEYRVTLGVRDIDEILPKLLEKLISEGVKTTSLRMRRANLEDAYLYYVGEGHG